MTVRRVRVRVEGVVQGVFFRESVRRRAEQEGLAGWARNRSDGSVEAVFEGDPEAVSRLVRFCEQGPRAARVDLLNAVEEEPEGLTGFSVA